MMEWNNIQNELAEREKKNYRAAMWHPICPMVSDASTPAECVASSCAWWDAKYGRCAVLSQACKK